MAFLNPRCDERIANLVGRGGATAPSEISRQDHVGFLSEALGNAATHSRAGALHYLCLDRRHLGALLEAGQQTYAEMVDLVVWLKPIAGLGDLYRAQHELIGVFRVGGAQLKKIGRRRRVRSNVWRYPSAQSAESGADESSVTPSIKPVALVADAIKDCTRRQDIVLDCFCNSGTTVLAAERVGCRAYGVEPEPRFVDVTIRRWQAFTKREAVHVETGSTFAERALGLLGSSAPTSG
jgi:hypothetical protein